MQKSNSAAFGSYSGVDRLLHNVAFKFPGIQKLLGDLEDDLYARDLATIVLEKPVFVTGLPRAGTTLLLEMLYGTGEFATFTYRQMPFVLAPLLWNRLSAPFQRAGESRERAHGDGVEISFDSPEAFEEVLWLRYLEDKIVGANALHPLPPSAIPEDFRSAFSQVIRKILLLNRNGGVDGGKRYLSKNNANISRLSSLNSMFPDSIVLLPFRNPLTHVKSLKTQHERFLGEHRADAFSGNYMKWIGHYDFGENFRPIDFDGSYRESRDLNDLDEDFWMIYWSAAYRYCLADAGDNVFFVDFDDLLENGERNLRHIATVTRIRHPRKLVEYAAKLRAPGSSPVAPGNVGESSLAAARAIHQELRGRAAR
jgi:hypothetical protein